MTPSILFFGNDTCHRLPVLAAAGFAVEHCSSVAQLSGALSAGPEPKAVLLCDHDGRLPEDAIALVRTYPAVPLILFRETNHLWDEAAFDLVIPVLTPPPTWLNEIAALLRNPPLTHPRLVYSQPQPTPAGIHAAHPSPGPGPAPAPVPGRNRSTRSA